MRSDITTNQATETGKSEDALDLHVVMEDYRRANLVAIYAHDSIVFKALMHLSRLVEAYKKLLKEDSNAKETG